MTPLISSDNSLATWLAKKWIGIASPSGHRAKLLTVKYHRADSSNEYGSKDYSVGSFETQIELLGKTFNTLTVADASNRIRNGTLPPRSLCITFDDGYADNFEIALPVLKRHGLKATFFIPSGLLGNSAMWNDRIASAFAAAGDNTQDIQNYLADAGMPVSYVELMEKLKYMSADDQETIIRGLSAFGNIKHESSKLMNDEQVRGLVEHGMEVGGHTVNHTILANVDDDQARHEISDCKSQLEAIINRPVVSFAYPNGLRGRDYTQRDINMVREAGYETAVNTELGLAERSDQLFELPRVSQFFITPFRLSRLYL